MCRHLAYVGHSRTLHELVFAPQNGLYRQSWSPRMQQHGTVNADGFGVGWWAGEPRQPVRYRRDVPLWSDPSIAEIASATATEALLAAVRSATDGTAPGVESAAPFSDGVRLFSHNGQIERWPTHLDSLLEGVPVSAFLQLVARTDSALLWLLVQRQLADGMTSIQALSQVVLDAQQASPGRYNLLMHDGEQITATCAGDTLFTRQDDWGVTVASEPCGNDDHWMRVPDGSAVVATKTTVDIEPITKVDL